MLERSSSLSRKLLSGFKFFKFCTRNVAKPLEEQLRCIFTETDVKICKIFSFEF